MFPLSRVANAPWNSLKGVLSDEWFNSVVNVHLPYIEEPSRKRGVKNAPKTVLQPISRLPDVKVLRLSFTDVENEDLVALQTLENLHSLTLQSTRIHEGPLDALAGLPLENLGIERTRFDDQGLASVAKIKTLKRLNLTRTKVTDEGLEHLRQHPNLETLILRRTLVSKQGYLALKQSMPNCKVSWEPLQRVETM